jgi:hypothetical protein
MPVQEQSLRAASAALHASTYDVAAGLSEATLTDFLAAHHGAEEASASSIYRGKGRAAEIGLSWSYHVKSPARLDLMPIAPATFARVYAGWMRTVPELARYVDARRPLGSEPNEAGTLADDPPPNVQVQVANVEVIVETDTGIKVPFNYAVTITGFVEVTAEDDTRVLRIVPVAAKVTDPAALNALVASAVPKATGMPAADCVELRKLILYLLNVLIANRIGSFVRQFSLPVPIDVVQGVTIGDVGLEVVDDLLVLMGRLSTTPAVVSNEQAALESGDHDRIMMAAQTAKSTPTSLAADAQRIPVRSLGERAALGPWPARGLFIILHERLFQAFAATVGYQTSAESCRSAFGLKGCLGYAMRVWGVTAQVRANALHIAAQFQASGWLKVCISTHCGSKCHTVSANPESRPNFDAVFAIRGRELWLTAAPGAFDIRWKIGGLPWPFNRLIEWALNTLSDVALLFARILYRQFEQKLTTFPEVFPGTSLRYTPSLDRQILKDPTQPALMILGELDFLP